MTTLFNEIEERYSVSIWYQLTTLHTDLGENIHHIGVRMVIWIDHWLSWTTRLGPSWLWSYGSWIYNYLCNQFLSPLMLWDQISIRARCTTLCDKVCQWLATGRWFSLVPPVSSTNKTDCHDITEILLKVTLNTIKQTNKPLDQFTPYTVNKVNIYTILVWGWAFV